MSSSDMSPIRFCVRVSVTTPGSLLGSSSENAVFSWSREASRAEAAAIASAPTRTNAGFRVSQRW